MTLYVVTAMTRPAGLPAIAAALAHMVEAGADIAWLVGHGTRDDPGGQRCKNRLIAQVPADAWLWICDDDTVPHPDLLAVLRAAWDAQPDAEVVVVSQERRGIPADGAPAVLHAAPDQMRVGSVDIGQLVMRRRALDGLALAETYDADGRLAEVLAARWGRRIVYVPQVASRHNWSR